MKKLLLNANARLNASTEILADDTAKFKARQKDLAIRVRKMERNIEDILAELNSMRPDIRAACPNDEGDKAASAAAKLLKDAYAEVKSIRDYL